MHGALAAGQRVAKLLAGGKGRGTGGEDLQLREDVGADLQQAGGVAELVDLVEDHDGLVARSGRTQRVADHVLDGGQVAVDVEDAVGAQALRQRGLAAAPDAAQPGDRRFAPGLLEPLPPEGSAESCNHTIHII